MAGLANLLIGGLIGSQMFGGKEKEQQGQTEGVMSPPNQQPTQVASNDTQQGQGGFGDIMSGFSNSLFKGMSQEQVARLGIGFNSMTLRPDDNIAASFQSKIDNAQKKTNRNATVDALIKMGKPNLANLVSTGAMDVKTAMTLAFKETTGDVKGTIAWMETFRGEDADKNSTIDSYRALIESAEGDDVAIREYVKMFANDFGVGVKDLKDTTSTIQIQQQDGVVMGEVMKAGQKYTIVTDEFGGQTLNIIDGAFGETEEMIYQRELKQQLHTADVKLAKDNAHSSYLEASNLLGSVQKYQNVQRTLKNLDGTFNEDAMSGWAVNMLPSFTAEMGLIRSTSNLMGIDVINMATFGALSEREMKMAMATNLDMNLPPEELYQMIVGMVESRTKLANELLNRVSRINELGSWEKYMAEQVVEQQGHIASRYKKMPTDVKEQIMIAKWRSDTKNYPEVTFETWNNQNKMSGYEIWSYLNFNDRANFIANMDEMTFKKFSEIMGDTEYAIEWWTKTQGAVN